MITCGIALLNQLHKKRAAINGHPSSFRAFDATDSSQLPKNPEGEYRTFPTPTEVRAFIRSGKRLCPMGEWLRVLRHIDG